MRKTLFAAAAVLLLGVGLALPACAVEGTSPTFAYLQQAQQASQARDAGAALAALDGAESAWLAADAARGNPIVHHERPALRAIGNARAAVRLARWGDAAHYIAAARSNAGMPGAG